MRKLLYILYAVMLSGVMSGCNDWLSPDRGDKILEKDAYKSETGINNVLNGLYRTLMSDDLYGNLLTGGTVDFFAHYYVYPTETMISESGYNKEDLQQLRALGEMDWVRYAGAREEFLDPIWEMGYKLILDINTFIKKMKEDTVLSEERRKLYMGEAYGLLALVHLDLYRLYGPLDYTQGNAMPFHGFAAMDTPDYLSGKDFLDEVMGLLDTADELLLETDPIVLDGKVWDGKDDDLDMMPEDIFAKMFRNRRMNYWAVQVLKMRVNTILNTPDSRRAVIDAADRLFAEAVDPDYTNLQTNQMIPKAKPFAWTPESTDAAIYSLYPILYDEVIMGPEDINMMEWWEVHMDQKQPTKQVRVFMTQNLNMNIMGTIGGNNSTDKRIGQFDEAELPMNAISNSSQTYHSSVKYRSEYKNGEGTKGNLAYNMKNMRALMRLAEVQYMKVEALLNGDELAPAIEALNMVLQNRGYDPNETATYDPTLRLPASASAEEIRDMLTREYYREFVYEGQAFYFVKRSAAVAGTPTYPIFNAYLDTATASTSFPTVDMTRAQFILPRPKGEVDFYPDQVEEETQE